MELPEDVQCDSAMRRTDGLVSLSKHGLPWIQRDVLGEYLMSQPVDLQQGLQFLQSRERERERERESNLTITMVTTHIHQYKNCMLNTDSDCGAWSNAPQLLSDN